MNITFPDFLGLRCLMMPYIQGEPDSVPSEYAPYMEDLVSFAEDASSLDLYEFVACLKRTKVTE